MIKEVKKEGGQWHAELRDKTTLRYMKVMQQRGVIKMQEHDIDHEMSDGSKVVAVTFEPVRNEILHSTDKLRKIFNADKEAEQKEVTPAFHSSEPSKPHELGKNGGYNGR